MTDPRRPVAALLENPRFHARTRTALLALRAQTAARRVSLDPRRSRSGLRALCQPHGATVSHGQTDLATHQHLMRW